jgi:hypothetical protein
MVQEDVNIPPPRWALELLTEFRNMQTEFRTMQTEFRTMQTEFDTVRTDLRRLSDQVHELQDNTRFDIADLKASVRLAYCRPGCARHLPHSPDACAALLACRGMYDSSMMSVSEIVADYVVNKRGHQLVGQFGGDCQAAARAAEEFFRSRKLMRSAFQECVLFSPSSAPIRFSDRVTALPPGSAPAKEGVLKRGMKAHKLIAGTCVWEPDHNTDHLVDEGAMGCNHFVATVTALGNERVAVDWGVGQFDFAFASASAPSSSPDLPCDVRLFF